jgi:flavorubredoxin
MRKDPRNVNLDYDYPVKIAEGVYWIGFHDQESGLHCNPYLIVDGAEAVVIDGGSRPDFPVVLMKILRTGLAPSSIVALIYDHFDPDLVGSVHNFESIIDRKDLQIISDAANNMFIRHYYVESALSTLEKINYEFKFSSGRTLQFIMTPYAHAQGSFVTFDSQTGIVFTGDIFGSYGTQWDLFLKLDDRCYACENQQECMLGKSYCPLRGMIQFHKNVMTSEKSLRLAINKILKLPLQVIAPQHGSVIYDAKDIQHISRMLISLKGVGVDGLSL